MHREAPQSCVALKQLSPVPRQVLLSTNSPFSRTMDTSSAMDVSNLKDWLQKLSIGEKWVKTIVEVNEFSDIPTLIRLSDSELEKLIPAMAPRKKVL